MKFKVRLRLASLISFFILLMLCLNLTNLISSEQARSTSFPASFSHPIILSSSVSPTKVQPGDMMTVSAVVVDFNGVDKVEARFFHEKGFDKVELSQVIGYNHLSVWNGQWIVHDTKTNEYTTDVTAFSRSGFSSSIDITWWDPIPWWNADFSYRKELSVSNAVSYYQMKLEVGLNSGSSSYDVHCEGNCNNNFSDLRFTASDGTTLRSYWIEEKTNGDDCTVWINSSGDDTMYMYYGNSQIGNQSDGDGTFLFFDDFNDASINTAKWNIGGSMSESGGVVSGSASGTDYLLGKTRININTLTFIRMRDKSTSGVARPGVMATNGNPYNTVGFGWQDYSDNYRYTDTYNTAVTQVQRNQFTTNWYELETSYNSTTVNFIVDGRDRKSVV